MATSIRRPVGGRACTVSARPVTSRYQTPAALLNRLGARCLDEGTRTSAPGGRFWGGGAPTRVVWAIPRSEAGHDACPRVSKRWAPQMGRSHITQDAPPTLMPKLRGSARGAPDNGRPEKPGVRDRREACGIVASTGSGVRPGGNPLDKPPDPALACAPHLYPVPFRALVC